MLSKDCWSYVFSFLSNAELCLVMESCKFFYKVVQKSILKSRLSPNMKPYYRLNWYQAKTVDKLYPIDSIILNGRDAEIIAIMLTGKEKKYIVVDPIYIKKWTDILNKMFNMDVLILHGTNAEYRKNRKARLDKIPYYNCILTSYSISSQISNPTGFWIYDNMNGIYVQNLNTKGISSNPKVEFKVYSHPVKIHTNIIHLPISNIVYENFIEQDQNKIPITDLEYLYTPKISLDHKFKYKNKILSKIKSVQPFQTNPCLSYPLIKYLIHYVMNINAKLVILDINELHILALANIFQDLSFDTYLFIPILGSIEKRFQELTDFENSSKGILFTTNKAIYHQRINVENIIILQNIVELDLDSFNTEINIYFLASSPIIRYATNKYKNIPYEIFIPLITGYGIYTEEKIYPSIMSENQMKKFRNYIN